MPSAAPSKERRKPRAGLRVVHLHRIMGKTSPRESDLMFVDGRPQALLEWINLGGVRTPLYSCQLEAARLRPADGLKGTYVYDGVTVDPRFDDSLPLKNL